MRFTRSVVLPVPAPAITTMFFFSSDTATSLVSLSMGFGMSRNRGKAIGKHVGKVKIQCTKAVLQHCLGLKPDSVNFALIFARNVTLNF